jgi:hypothetical protein
MPGNARSFRPRHFVHSIQVFEFANRNPDVPITGSDMGHFPSGVQITAICMSQMSHNYCDGLQADPWNEFALAQLAYFLQPTVLVRQTRALKVGVPEVIF